MDDHQAEYGQGKRAVPQENRPFFCTEKHDPQRCDRADSNGGQQSGVRADGAEGEKPVDKGKDRQYDPERFVHLPQGSNKLLIYRAFGMKEPFV